MTVAKAINKATAIFAKQGPELGDIRTVKLMSGCHSGKDWSQLTICVEYAINGDYTASDNHPFMVEVWDKDGKITAERIIE